MTASGSTNVAETASVPSLAVRIGLGILRFLRWFYGLFYFLGGIYKIWRGWLWTDALQTMFAQRLTELDSGSFASIYLAKFGVPMYMPIAWAITFGEIIVGIGFLAGLAMRINIWLALFLTVNIGIGGYYDASLLPFLVIPVLLLIFPGGRTPGLDAGLRARYPGSFWFR